MSQTDQAALSGMLAKMLSTQGQPNANPEEQKNTGGGGHNAVGSGG